MDEPLQFDIVEQLPDDPHCPNSSEEKCAVCGRGEKDGIIDALNIVLVGDILNWVYCEKCSKCFHFICVGLDENENLDEVDWLCPECLFV